MTDRRMDSRIDRRTDRRTEAIAISPTLFFKKRGDNNEVQLPKGHLGSSGGKHLKTK